MGMHPIFEDVLYRPEPMRRLDAVLPAVMDTVEAAVVAKRGVVDLIAMRAFADGWEAPSPASERGRMLAAAMVARGTSYSFRGSLPKTHDAWSLLRTCAATATQRDCVDVERHDPSPLGMTEDRARIAFLQWGLTEVKARYAEPGDVLLFAMEGGVHPAIMSAPGGEFVWSMLPNKAAPVEARMVHALWTRAVSEAWVGPYWTEKNAQVIGVFSFDAPKSPVRAVQVAA